MDIAHKISSYLNENAPQALCDDCLFIALALSRRQQAFRVTSALATTRDYTRNKGRCHTCGHDKLVINANNDGLTTLNTLALLQQHGAAISELKRRKVLRTENNPIGDYAESLFCSTFNWLQKGNSANYGCREHSLPDQVTPPNKAKRLASTFCVARLE